MKKQGRPNAPKMPKGASFSEDYLNERNTVPQVSPLMAHSVSQARKDMLANEVAQGIYREGTGPAFNSTGLTKNSIVSAAHGHMYKQAQMIGDSDTVGAGFANRGGDTAKQIPQIYSPLWLTSNLNLPRDRATINAWCRAFFALNPYVHNAINFHSTYPISKLSVKCADPAIQRFWDEQLEELDLLSICAQIAQEYFLLGEAFPYSEYDRNKGKWSRIMLQNPDYMIVKRTVIANEPYIMLRPDENLKRLVHSNRPADVEQRKQLNQHIITSVKRGENIPLDNFSVSHIARKISPYEIRGTGLPVCIFRYLMLYDKIYEAKFTQADQMINPLTLIKVGATDGMENLHPTSADLEEWRQLFECYDEETEVLTQDGFKKMDEVIEYSTVMDGTNAYPTIVSRPKSGVQIACFNSNTEQLEYHAPSKSFVGDYEGEMYHYHNEKIDLRVTPNHDLWVSQYEYKYHGSRASRTQSWGQWKKVKAQDLKLTNSSYGNYRFRSKAGWQGKDDQKIVIIAGHEVPIELYLEYLGYVLSEGCVFTNGNKHSVGIYQTVTKFHKEMKECCDKLSECLDKSYSSTIADRSKYGYEDIWRGVFSGKDLYDHIKREVGDDEGRTKAPFKRIPRWILELSPRLLNIILDAMVKGDGTVYASPKNRIVRFHYYSTSKQLADDVYEIVYKCGHVPTMMITDPNQWAPEPHDTIWNPYHTVMWSTSGKGGFPLVYKQSRNGTTGERKSTFDIEQYQGKVWCFTVPTGLFVTRRNGKITIQSNSLEYDPDAKIITHPGVTVERVGYNQGIYDVSNDITQLTKTIQVGLFMPPVLLDGGADTTYANGSVALDALRQRYMQFRNLLTIWLKRKIFAPIAHVQGFYDIKDKQKQLIIPEVDWNHMSLFDAGDFISNLITLTQPAGENGPAPRVSVHTLYRSIGLEWEDEQRKLRLEAIQAEITRKEAESLKTMSLSELRTLGEKDEDIPEPPQGVQQGEAPVPGEVGPGLPSMDLGGGLPGLGGGGGGGGAPPIPPPPAGGPPPPVPEAPPSGGAPAAPPTGGGPPPAP